MAVPILMFFLLHRREGSSKKQQKGGAVVRYEGMLEARFLSRPNRFVAMVELEGQEVVCHV